jgi:hypothetical protein
MVNGTVEGGSNSGSDWDLVRYTDAGTLINPSVLHFDRATGLGTVLAPPTAPLGIATKNYVDSVAGGGASDPPFPAGTTMLFVQAAAPIGWVQSGSGNHNDRALRVVNTATGGAVGGSYGFSTIFSQTVVGSATPSTTTMAAHDHAVYDPTHAHTYSVVRFPGGGGLISAGPNYGVQDFDATTIAAYSNVAIYSNGSGGAHNHTINMNLAYLDVIVCTKS